MQRCSGHCAIPNALRFWNCSAAVKNVLMDRLEMGQSAVSYHMKILCESGIVASRQEGKWTHYRLSDTGRGAAAELLMKLTTPDLGPSGEEDCCR